MLDMQSADLLLYHVAPPDYSNKNGEGIVSPSWSIHSGVATAAYSFIWAMAGENSSFADMDFVNIMNLK